MSELIDVAAVRRQFASLFPGVHLVDFIGKPGSESIIRYEGREAALLNFGLLLPAMLPAKKGQTKAPKKHGLHAWITERSALGLIVVTIPIRGVCWLPALEPIWITSPRGVQLRKVT
jgi:hypothetical protein